ncbi:unnamed protein product, partial [Rotaria sp. Silwood2]
TLYDWYDPIQQRSTSPPQGTYLSIDAQLPYFERTVTVSVEKDKRLGLVIRGGAEYDLGIFISGVDKGSLSDQSGLSIGDQILSILYSTNELDIIIRTLRINALDATLYDWYDPIQQRSTSPPQGTYLSID